MTYKITTLVDNVVYGRKLQAEHGLSLSIQTDQHHILFDTGQSDLFIRNAELLHVDLSTVDYLILSHGHSDHTGGLRHFLKLNSKAKVICKREALFRKFKDKRENGILQSEELNLSRFQFITEQTELVPGVFLFPSLPILNKQDTHFDHFFTETPEGIIPDTFEDELAIVLTTEERYAVISACSHRGITNILQAIRSVFPNRHCQLLLGGFHIHNAERKKFEIIADYLKENPAQQIGICHCTGFENYAHFCQIFGEGIFYNYTGTSFTL